jgi:hypothetical protein
MWEEWIGAKVSVDPNENAWVARLAAVEYRDVDEDFVRFHDDPVDESLKSIVASVVATDDSQRDRFRRALGPDSIETLRLYAQRRILQSQRRSSMNLVEDAMDAFALVPASDVPWDTWLKAGLFIARSLGRDIDSIGEHFGEVSTVQSAERFDVAFEAMSRIESLAQCFIAEVTTNYGTGFIETIVHRDTQSIGSFFSAPRQADDIVTYEPTTNLAQLAASLADALDATESLHTGAIAQDQLAGMSFSQQVSGAFLETTGCLSFYAGASDDDKSFKVFVAELPEDTDVESLASGAEGDDQAVCFDDRRLILYLAPPNFDDGVDTSFDFGDYLNVARQSLRASTPVGWHNR